MSEGLESTERIEDLEKKEPIVVTVTYPDRKLPFTLWLLLIWIIYFLWHMHADIWSLQIQAGLIDKDGHVKAAIRQQMHDDTWRQLGWR